MGTFLLIARLCFFSSLKTLLMPREPYEGWSGRVVLHHRPGFQPGSQKGGPKHLCAHCVLMS